jgi:hypothetical protein
MEEEIPLIAKRVNAIMEERRAKSQTRGSRRLRSAGVRGSAC